MKGMRKRSVWLFGRSLFVLAAVVAIVGYSVEGHGTMSEGPVVKADRSHVHDEVPGKTLLAKAQSKGRVRVIVDLANRSQAEGDWARRYEVDNQHQAIARTQETVLTRLAAYDVTLMRQFKYVSSMALEVDAATLVALQRDPHVTRIQEDVPVSPTLADSVPLINADGVVTEGVTGEGQTIAILDTGVDHTHEFLAGKVVAEACFSSDDAFANASTVCPNGMSTQVGPGAGRACDASVDGCSHGTHVAGIAVGAASPAGFDGVAKAADIIAIQVFSRFDDSVWHTLCADNGHLSPCALTYPSDQIAALEHVFTLSEQYAIAAVNMSLGGGRSTDHCDDDLRKDAIDNLRSVGIATVIASGNASYDDAMGAPACISTAVSVGATGKDDIVADFSNSASFLSLLAPGVSITSSVPGNAYEAFGGTSMAAPHVAGAFALLKQAQPAATVEEILVALQDTGVRIMDHRSAITIRRIDVQAALEALDASASMPAITNP